MFFWNSLAFSVINGCWQFDFWFLCLFYIQLEHLEVLGSCTVEAWLGEFWVFVSMWNECNCTVVWTFFGIAFLWDWNENWPFPVLWPLLSFPNLLAHWVQLFRSSACIQIFWLSFQENPLGSYLFVPCALLDAIRNTETHTACFPQLWIYKPENNNSI